MSIRVLKDEYKILDRFAGNPFYVEVRHPLQKKYSRNLQIDFCDKNYKIYITKDFQIVITKYPLRKNQRIFTDGFKRFPYTLKNIQYIRLCKPFKNEGFIHYFTGKEHMYTKRLDKHYKNMVYIICSKRVLAKEIEKKSKPFKIF